MESLAIDMQLKEEQMEKEGIEDTKQQLQKTTSGELNRMIQAEAVQMLGRLERMRKQAKFPSFGNVNVPTVLLLGNHSAGKSTFINYMMKQEVQKTGRAPTDSTFTVIAGGNRAERLDGYALLRNSQYGFGELQNLFGDDLVSQIEMKVVKDCDLLDRTGMLLIDSPGMIDQPGDSRNPNEVHRGYDFKNVTRWFADRADVILVMFDPDKPGTTFETLDILTSSLQHVTNKVHLILNKVDDFKSIHDFARAYGALCWNLSRMITRKDLPYIYAMYVPQDKKSNVVASDKANGSLDTDQALAQILEKEFDGTRNEVLREVERAPDRSTDNIINHLKSQCGRLQMHCKILDECREDYSFLDRFWKGVTYGIGAVGVAAVAIYIIRTTGRSAMDVKIPLEASPSTTSTKPSVSSAGSGSSEWKKDWARQVERSHSVFSWYTLLKLMASTGASVLTSIQLWKSSLRAKQTSIVDQLPSVFRRVYANSLVKSDEVHDQTIACWTAVHPGLIIALKALQLRDIPTFIPRDQKFLEDVLSVHIPRLDRSVRNRAGNDHAYLNFKHRFGSAIPPSN